MCVCVCVAASLSQSSELTSNCKEKSRFHLCIGVGTRGGGGGTGGMCLPKVFPTPLLGCAVYTYHSLIPRSLLSVVLKSGGNSGTRPANGWCRDEGASFALECTLVSRPSARQPGNETSCSVDNCVFTIIIITTSLLWQRKVPMLGC